jgi:hypothetical protein
MNKEITPANQYSAAMDSVNLINNMVLAEENNQTQEQRREAINRNVEHLKLAIAWDIWTTEDISPFNLAIANGSNWLSNN